MEGDICMDKELMCLRGKIIIDAKLTVVTGLHIGGGSDFSPIGAVDSPFIRDALTKRPIIPGSSLKGKIRTLLAKANASTHKLQNIKDDNAIISRLFGNTAKEMAKPARLQFYDLFVNRKSEERYSGIDTDTYLGEVKFENTISRSTGIANPRQIERVPAGLEFDFRLVYNVEKEEDIKEDLECLCKGLELLQYDYLGGHGSRGYGRVKFSDYSLSAIGDLDIECDKYKKLFEGCGGL